MKQLYEKSIQMIKAQNRKLTVREYNNEVMAKVELDAKQIKGSTVIIEYKINVTNNGEVEYQDQTKATKSPFYTP